MKNSVIKEEIEDFVESSKDYENIPSLCNNIIKE